MIFDLHTHSTASDGLLSPQALIERAEANGVAQLALTDHDTVAGVQELQQLLAQRGEQSAVSLVAGVEITADLDGRNYHILGLWIDADNTALQSFLADQAQVRELRAEAIDAKLQKRGIVGALQGARRIADGAVLSRPHFARYLLEQGHCAKEQQAYTRWLGAGKCCDIPCQWPSVETAIAVIHEAGGLAVLAHPDKYGLTQTRLRALLEAFKAAGGDGLELISGRQEQTTTDYLLQLSQKYDLACSIGSDFHSPDQLWSDLGSNLALPEAAVPIWALRGERISDDDGQSARQ